MYFRPFEDDDEDLDPVADPVYCDYDRCENTVEPYPENEDKFVAMCPEHQAESDEHPCFRCGTTSRLDWESEVCCETCRREWPMECEELFELWHSGEQEEGEIVQRALRNRKAAFRQRLTNALKGAAK
jgi:hypothetical protein